MENKPLHKMIRDDLFYLLVLVFIGLLRLLPRRTALALMRALGRLAFMVSAGPRKRAIGHLTRVYGDVKSPEEIHEMARKVFIHFATAAGDLLRMREIIRKGIDQLVSVKGIENVDKAMESGKGVLLVTCHFGNWELLGAWLAQNGYPMSVVGTTLFDPRLDRILVETRNMAGYRNIARGKGPMDILRTLKKGEAVGMLIDQDTKSQGTFVNFFGRPAHTPTGPAVLARKLNIPIIPIYMYLKEDLSYQLECHPPLALVRSDDEESDINANTQMISDSYEAMIRRFPEQWAWMHKRWKTRQNDMD